ncbi:MAG: hypothetical protein EXR36_14040 [Betaproteobacteria bacterium]|nr:hypothetical protein [Betaproteobacteria bacterium]
MKHRPILWRALGAMLVTGISGVPALANEEELPPVVVRKQSGFSYISGGLGELGRKAMAKVANKYPMQLIFTAEGEGPDVAGVKVTVWDRRLKKQIEAVAEGPAFYFTPDSGRWTIEAEYRGETVSRTVDLIGRRYILLEFHFKGPAAVPNQ